MMVLHERYMIIYADHHGDRRADTTGAVYSRSCVFCRGFASLPVHAFI